MADPAAKMAALGRATATREITELDGLSVDYEDWHFNVRPSNTEPLLRLNLESLVSEQDMEAAATRCSPSSAHDRSCSPFRPLERFSPFEPSSDLIEVGGGGGTRAARSRRRAWPRCWGSPGAGIFAWAWTAAGSERRHRVAGGDRLRALAVEAGSVYAPEAPRGRRGWASTRSCGPPAGGGPQARREPRGRRRGAQGLEAAAARRDRRRVLRATRLQRRRGRRAALDPAELLGLACDSRPRGGGSGGGVNVGLARLRRLVAAPPLSTFVGRFELRALLCSVAGPALLLLAALDLLAVASQLELVESSNRTRSRAYGRLDVATRGHAPWVWPRGAPWVPGGGGPARGAARRAGRPGPAGRATIPRAHFRPTRASFGLRPTCRRPSRMERALSADATASTSLPIPTPFAVGRVNCYLIEDDPLTLVDTGPNSATSLTTLEAALAEHGRQVEDLERIVITHQHIDHIGLVQILADRSGAEVCALDPLAPWLASYREGMEADDAFAEALMPRHGIPRTSSSRCAPCRARSAPGARRSVSTPLADGERLEFAGRTWRV